MFKDFKNEIRRFYKFDYQLIKIKMVDSTLRVALVVYSITNSF